MLISPDIHIVITVSAEVVERACETIAFIAMCWAIVRIITAMNKPTKKTGEQP